MIAPDEWLLRILDATVLSLLPRSRKIDLGVFGVRTVQQGGAPDRPNDLHLVERIGNRLRHVTNVPGAIVEHPDGHKLSGIKGLLDGLLNGRSDSLFPNVNMGILPVGEATKMGPLRRGESIGHDRTPTRGM